MYSYPQFLELFDHDFKQWMEEIRYIHELRPKTRAILATMPPRFYKRYELSDSDLAEWAEIVKEQPNTYVYLAHDLTQIVNTHVPIHNINVVPVT